MYANPTAFEVKDFHQGSLKYDYFGGLVYPRIKNKTFKNKGFDISIKRVDHMRSFFLGRGGYPAIITLSRKGLPFAHIGMRLINPEGRRVQIKSIYLTPTDPIKKVMERINVTRGKEGQREMKMIIELVANPKKKIFIRPQSVNRIIQSLINEAALWNDAVINQLIQG